MLKAVLKTFSVEEQESAQQYFAYQKLKNENPERGYKRLAKALGVNKTKTRAWKQWNSKPIGVKTVEELQKAGVLPFCFEDEKAPIIARIFGTLYGDGGVDANLNNVFFGSGDLEDIELWKRDLLTVFPFAERNLSLVKSGEYGDGNCLRCTNRMVIRFFVALKAPLGSKIIREYQLPEWVKQAPNDLTAFFLDGFLACEVGTPQFYHDRRNNSEYLYNFSFNLSKWEALEESHLLFLYDLKRLCSKIGVKTHAKPRKDVHLKTERKDGRTSYSYRVHFCTSLDNVLLFDSLFPLTYAKKKKQNLAREIIKSVRHHELLQRPVNALTAGRFNAIIKFHKTNINTA